MPRTTFLIGLSLLFLVAGVNSLPAANKKPHVAPADEIVILDPRVDSEGKPAVVLQPGGGEPSTIDIPPVVIVHRYYYTGDRSFQGPRFPGGPSILVVSHPVSGERLYVEAQMLPGAPRITYRRDYIDYDFGKRSIRLSFGHGVRFGHVSAPKIVYHRGRSLRTSFINTGRKSTKKTASWLERSGVSEAVHRVVDGASNTIHGTADGVRTVGEFVTAPAIQLINATPLGSILNGNPEQRAQQERDAAVQRAVRKNRKLSGFIPTVR